MDKTPESRALVKSSLIHEQIFAMDANAAQALFSKLSLAEKVALGKTDDGKVNTGNWYSDGVEAGIASAANDYLNDKVDLSVFDVKNEDEDSYTFGFECGYMRKLAEILVG